MACAEFEELLLEYAELAGDERERTDTHIAHCDRCRDFFEALRAVDAALTSQFADREVTSVFTSTVRQRVQREVSPKQPSWIPEILDFVGWAAVVALLGLLAWWISPQLPGYSVASFLTAPFAAAAAFLVVAFLIGLRSFADLKH